MNETLNLFQQIIMFYNNKNLAISTITSKLQHKHHYRAKYKKIKWVDGDDLGKSAQIPYWFKESFL